jgi:hypothetical protein
MFSKRLLVLSIALVFITAEKCSNKSALTNTFTACSTFLNSNLHECGPYGGGGMCMCPNGCEKIGNYCGKLEVNNPTITILKPAYTDNIEKCNNGCIFDTKYNACMQDNSNSGTICEPVIGINCPFVQYCPDDCSYNTKIKKCVYNPPVVGICNQIVNYQDTYLINNSNISLPLEYCNTYNSHKICVTNYGIIRYPLRLKDMYKNIMCKYSTTCDLIQNICCNY